MEICGFRWGRKEDKIQTLKENLHQPLSRHIVSRGWVSGVRLTVPVVRTDVHGTRTHIQAKTHAHPSRLGVTISHPAPVGVSRRQGTGLVRTETTGRPHAPSTLQSTSSINNQPFFKSFKKKTHTHKTDTHKILSADVVT